MIWLILRHAWLNLWDKHMTTGRINQVSSKITTNSKIRVISEIPIELTIRKLASRKSGETKNCRLAQVTQPNQPATLVTRLVESTLNSSFYTTIHIPSANHNTPGVQIQTPRNSRIFESESPIPQLPPAASAPKEKHPARQHTTVAIQSQRLTQAFACRSTQNWTLNIHCFPLSQGDW